MRVLALLAATLAVALGGCGETQERPAASEREIAEFFDGVTGNVNASYIARPTLGDAGAAAELVVIGKLVSVAPGPFIGALPEESFLGIPTKIVTLKVKRVLAGTAPGDTVDFLVFAEHTGETTVASVTPTLAKTNVMLLLYLRSDGKLEFGGPTSLLVESGGAVTAPLVEDKDGEYIRGVKRNRTLDEAGVVAVKQRRP